ncbi:hypothetical protein [Methylovirgula sp. 4M-Z18]|uniref:hypothetical protein n=1 Tax=Methylovirgula sp. 4M-Z18 TaxID=2293567 RepID=UPI001314FDA6|nr:hypothetical protein [Methylovirgula sp. 4M-Z18]
MSRAPRAFALTLAFSPTFASLIPVFAASAAPIESEHGKRDVITLVFLQVE